MAKKRKKKIALKKPQKPRKRKKRGQSSVLAWSSSAVVRIRASRHYPIHECLINKKWKENGLARILISRKQPDGDLIFASYLVDVFCLGLKNTMCNVDMSPRRLDRELKKDLYAGDQAVACPPHMANQIIYGAINYAAELGFKPNKDFRDSQYVLEERDESQETYEVSFGKDGKPFFISGPYDNASRIIATLQEKLGPDGFHFFAEMGELEDIEDVLGEADWEEAEWEEIEDEDLNEDRDEDK